MAVPFSENGGFAATQALLFVPVQTADQGISYIGVFDPADFNDDQDGSSYTYRAEDVMPNRQPTVRRVIMQYKDIGMVKLTISIEGTNDDNEAITSSAIVTIGSAAATGKIFTKFIDLVFTGFRPQLTWQRAANAGPVCVVSMSMVGE